MDALRSVLNDRGGIFDEATARIWLDAASEQVQRYCDRTFLPDPAPPVTTPTVRVVRAQHRRTVRIPDTRVLVSVSADGTDLTDEQYELITEGTDPATTIRLHGDARRITLTGLFGWAPPPPCAVMATLVLAARFYQERDARQADQVIDPVGGAANYFRQLPASVQSQLNLYRNPGL